MGRANRPVRPVPTLDLVAPTRRNDVPTTGNDAPTVDEASPTAGNGAPTADEASPTAGNDAPTADEASPTAGNEAKSVGLSRPLAEAFRFKPFKKMVLAGKSPVLVKIRQPPPRRTGVQLRWEYRATSAAPMAWESSPSSAGTIFSVSRCCGQRYGRAASRMSRR